MSWCKLGRYGRSNSVEVDDSRFLIVVKDGEEEEEDVPISFVWL